MPPKKTTTPEPVTTTQKAHPRAVEEALRLAGNDRARLRFLDDGSVLVANERRTANRPVR